MHDYTQRLRRATVGTSILGWVALACLILNAAFWASLMLDLLRPPSPFSPQALQAGLAVIAFAAILPLFLSMLIPNSPAGRLLQKQSWATPGYTALGVAAIFLVYIAQSWLRIWWQAQPGIAETGQDLVLTITSLIAGVLVPALCWSVTTPERWVAAIEQARAVKRLEASMKMEDAAMRAAYARAVSLLNADLTNLTINQKRELAGILGGFARTQQHALASIAASWRDMYGVEATIATVPDQKLLDQFQTVAELLTDGADVMADSADYAGDVRALPTVGDRTNEQRPRPTVAHQDTETGDRERFRPRTATVPPRTTGDSRISTANDILDAAQRALGASVWTRADLEEVLSIQKTKANEYIKAWRQAGEIVDITNPAYHYQFSEV
jgi:hypothetical protein